ncbi:MAG: hypothetical protein OXP66_05530 [Candidatus Tectomicrobia bacterium]|nr:hypothetical protein [Candidatus Tectomicrobia bacterium]
MQGKWDVATTLAVLSLSVAILAILLSAWSGLSSDVRENAEGIARLEGALTGIAPQINNELQKEIHKLDKALSLSSEDNRGWIREHESRIRALEGRRSPASEPAEPQP